MKKNIVFITIILFTLLLIPIKANEVGTGWKPDSDNTSGNGETAASSYCADCEYGASSWKGFSEVVIKNGDDQIKFNVCNSTTANVHPDECHIVIPDMPNPMYYDDCYKKVNGECKGSFVTNDDYNDYIDEWLKKMVVDEKLDMDHAAARAYVEINCGTDPSDECIKELEKNVAESNDDLTDITVAPGAILCETVLVDKKMVCIDGTTTFVSTNDFSCNNGIASPKYSGVNGVLCDVLREACHAGSDTSFSNIKEGDVGLCTGDLFNKIDGQTCRKTCDSYKLTESECNDFCCEVECMNAGGDVQSCIAECYDGDKPDDPDDPDDPIDPNGPTCPPLETCEDCIYEPTLPDNSSEGGTCGVNFSGTFYDWGEPIGDPDFCKTSYIKQTDLSIIVPSDVPNSVYAGQGFNWGGMTGTATIKTYPGPTTGLEVRQKELDVRRTNLINQFNCDKEKAKFEYDRANMICDSCETAANPNDCKTANNCDNLTRNYNSKLQTLSEKYETDLETIDEEQEKINNCWTQIRDAKTTVEIKTDVIAVSDAELKLGDFSQIANTYIAILKNSGLGSKKLTSESYDNEYNFFIPSSVKASSGTLKQRANLLITVPNFSELSVVCKVDVKNELIDNGGLNLIYRPISLTTPYPNINDADSFRDTIGFWTDHRVIDKLILHNRSVNDYEVYSLEPMYTITLTPKDIKEIRKYNDRVSYNDFNMKCENGLYCRSNFLWSDFNYLIDGSKSCAMSSEWYACDDAETAKIRDDMIADLK